MLDEHAVLEHPDLGELAALTHDHDPLDALAPREELGLGDDRAAPAGLAALAATLTLGLQAGGALDAGGDVAVAARLAHLGDGAGRVLARRRARPAAAAAPRALASRAVVLGGVAVAGLVVGIVLVVGALRGVGPLRCLPLGGPRGLRVGVVGAVAAVAAPALAAPPAATALTAAVVVRVVVAVVRVVVGAPGLAVLVRHARVALVTLVGAAGSRAGVVALGVGVVGRRVRGLVVDGRRRPATAAAALGRGLRRLEQQPERRHRRGRQALAVVGLAVVGLAVVVRIVRVVRVTRAVGVIGRADPAGVRCARGAPCARVGCLGAALVTRQREHQRRQQILRGRAGFVSGFVSGAGLRRPLRGRRGG